ncbi:MAG TPA: efflux RND transporter periplasmic adaptor subunit [Kiritimatiellia bacterium]|nr:efflux RND transporter periplasmic adaptor subunit [Kiritimatiellia bacterium]HMO99714.1 efflux RND transporter periplasmic adaptor subunit [Kiritimatiellia bacterium]HMP97057.1 efflux RND transporter periplasmic adaptor subunit [Kiritimatiellia bacterium]
MNLNRLGNCTPWFAGLVVAAALTACGREAAPRRADAVHVIERRDFSRWSAFEGTIQAEQRAPIYSRISQPTAVLFLAAEGSQVEAGEVVAELDRSALDQALVGHERDFALADAELKALLEAEIPMERDSLEYEINAQRYERLKQERVLEHTRALHASGLVSDSELEGQEVLASNLEKQIALLESRRENLRTILHPAREAKARAQREAAWRQLELVRAQAEGARLVAPISGMVVYLPLHLDGEFRNVREGDTVYRNQKIMQIADMTTLIVHCLVPESSLSLVRPGFPVVVTPSAFPDLRLAGEVEAVGSVAMPVSGRPAWQKFFNVTLRLRDTDERLRSNMSVAAQVLSFQHDQAVVIPRAWVMWEDGQAWCLVREGGWKRRALELGPGNDGYFVVNAGLEAGDTVALPGVRP